MEDNPLISIIIPTFNREYVIWETLDSILDQSYVNWECIIVDDGGNDKTEDLVEKYIIKNESFKYVKRPGNLIKGVCSCRNYGLMISRGEFIIFLDSDDILATSALENRINYFKQYPDNDFLVFTTQFFEKKICNKKNTCNIDPIIDNRENYLSLFLNYRFPWQIMSPIWKKSTLLNNKFRNELHLLEDVVFHIEILFIKKIKFKRINLIDNYYRIPSWGRTNNSESVDRIFQSVSFLLKNYNYKINQNNVLRKNFPRFIKIIYSIIIKSNKSNSEKEKMLRDLIKYNYISREEILLFKVYSIIYKFKFNEVKGIGVYKLLNFLNKRLF